MCASAWVSIAAKVPVFIQALLDYPLLRARRVREQALRRAKVKEG